eukprot:s1863_g10.t1
MGEICNQKRPISPRISRLAHGKRYEANARHVMSTPLPLLAKLRPKTVSCEPCTQMIIAASNMNPNPGWSPRLVHPTLVV